MAAQRTMACGDIDLHLIGLHVVRVRIVLNKLRIAEPVQLRLLYPCLYRSPKAFEAVSEKKRQTLAVQVVNACIVVRLLASAGRPV